MALKRLDQEYRFDSKTPINNTLNRLLAAVEARLAPLEQQKDQIDQAISELTAVGLDRMNDVFTPLIETAMAQLANFGSQFSATSTTTQTIGLGTKVFTLPELQRGSFIPSQFMTARHVGGVESMSGTVSYDRDLGELAFAVDSYNGAGTFSDWDIKLDAEPDRTHAARIDNPHLVTALQVGAYTTAQVDAAIAAEHAAILGGVGPAYDTLQEIADWIALENSVEAGVTTSLANRLRFDADQTLSATQKAQARKNIARTIATLTSATAVTIDDRERVFFISGSWTLSHTLTAVQAGSGFRYMVKNTGLGTITIDPNGTETIDGLTTLKCLAKQQFEVVSDGTNWLTVGRRGIVTLGGFEVTTSVASIEFVVPPDYDQIEFNIVDLVENLNTNCLMRIAIDGAATYLTSASYFIQTLTGVATTAAATQILGTASFTLHTASNSAAGNIIRMLLNNRGQRPHWLVSSFAVIDGTGSLSAETRSGWNNSGTGPQRATNIKFFPGSGNFDKGLVQMVGRTF